MRIKPERVEDVCLTPVNLIIASHLDRSASYVRVLLMDFSSAFNTIQLHLLILRLLNLDTNHPIVLWIRQVLCVPPQSVSLNGTFSDELIVNTRATQGCVLSPVLFVLCIH